MEQHSVFNLNKARDFKEEKSIKNKLTQSDRVLLRSFLGYCKIRQFPNDDLKKWSDSCDFVRSMLWPEGDENLTQDEFDLHLLTGKENNSIPRLFPMDLEEIKKLFQEGRRFTDIQEIAFLRCFNVRKKDDFSII